jgi:hypothetical protein
MLYIARALADCARRIADWEPWLAQEQEGVATAAVLTLVSAIMLRPPENRPPENMSRCGLRLIFVD